MLPLLEVKWLTDTVSLCRAKVRKLIITCFVSAATMAFCLADRSDKAVQFLLSSIEAIHIEIFKY